MLKASWETRETWKTNKLQRDTTWWCVILWLPLAEHEAPLGDTCSIEPCSAAVAVCPRAGRLRVREVRKLLRYSRGQEVAGTSGSLPCKHSLHALHSPDSSRRAFSLLPSLLRERKLIFFLGESLGLPYLGSRRAC